MDDQQRSESEKSFLADLKFIGYVFNSIEFTRNEFYKGEEAQIDFRFGHNILLNQEENSANISLTCTVFPDAKINHYPFNLNVEIAGMFAYNPEIDDDLRDVFLGENALALLFPYVRSTISMVTASAGFTPLLIQPINVVEYIKSQKTESNKEEMHESK